MNKKCTEPNAPVCSRRATGLARRKDSHLGASGSDLLNSRVLIYKRTHPGDPDANGQFGIYDCMGRVRDYSFGAVIGIGGISREPRSHGINGKINWIGVGPFTVRTTRRGNRVVKFRRSRFRLFEENGEDLSVKAPTLAKRMYAKHAPRFLLASFSKSELREIKRIVAIVKD